MVSRSPPGVQYTLPGTHDFVALGPNGARVTEHLSVIAGASYRVTLSLSQSPIRAAADEVESPSAADTQASARRDQPARASSKPLPPVVFWIGAAGSAVLAGLTTWSGVDALSAKRESGAYTQPEIDEIEQPSTPHQFLSRRDAGARCFDGGGGDLVGRVGVARASRGDTTARRRFRAGGPGEILRGLRFATARDLPRA